MTPTPTTTTPDLELAPSYGLPIAIFLGAIPLYLLSPWAGGIVGVFSLFLIIQAATIRLRFTAIALDVYRSGTLIRNFPYADWQNWRVFWPGLPILFYFREVNSIHFLPMLFNSEQLLRCLEPLPRVD
ncbi:DUF3119 family protein [Spirulina major CS-329]|jgi:hypothetical protein|uniref:DUF3119 family protein n=1 Tax=Spirulina TaxID=1154 RepID=UPI0023306744|nr:MULTISPECIES: DUF3119 family protein [Spirulina]MDB9493751.1 DUF3119 family protein [Spirulina subsalsa CS-330]MDB9503567.1 DUF3119 family protein [Spirulina major CS-329]